MKYEKDKDNGVLGRDGPGEIRERDKSRKYRMHAKMLLALQGPKVTLGSLNQAFSQWRGWISHPSR